MAWPDLNRPLNALRAFLESVRPDRRDATHTPRVVDHYARVIVRAGDALGDPPWRPRAVLRYLLYLSRVYAPRYLLLIAHVLRLYHRERGMPICDSGALQRWRRAVLAQQASPLRRPLTAAQLHQLACTVEAQPPCRRTRNAVLLGLVLDTAWHVAKVLRLRWSDLVTDADGGWQLIAEGRRVPLSPSTSYLLTRWRKLNPTEHVLCGIRQERLHLRPLNPNSAVKVLQRLFRGAGLTAEQVAHRIRHTIGRDV
jgi:integrase